jgi:bifunctional UDP-N-acetylglucosamine pyrophosphorylase/glucosamine-1-phosphate N-acetyltransferase
MLAGVTLSDPDRIDIRGSLEVGSDCEIDVNVIFEGTVVLGDNVKIGPQCVIRDSNVGDGSIIHPFSLLDSDSVGKDCQIGPFARLRPGVEIADRAKIGNFVEVKQSRIGPGSKVNHLSYVGDSELGRNVNIGAGTITCNYDGANKHKTVIKDEAFIGSNTSLVAPVSVGSKATVGAGSTIARDVADGQLSLTRGKQRSVDGWNRPVKTKDA